MFRDTVEHAHLARAAGAFAAGGEHVRARGVDRVEHADVCRDGHHGATARQYDLARPIGLGPDLACGEPFDDDPVLGVVAACRVLEPGP